ncbi:MAG: hypothetical protein AB1440_05580 [Pseudomonadota bacterium]|jgi:hypothetical protein
MNQRTQQIVSRIRDEKLREAAAACLAVADRFRARADAIKGDPSFTQIGRDKALQDEATKNFLPGLKAASQPIARALAEANQARAAISLPAPDKSDIAGALERQEIRAFVRAMEHGDRISLLFGTVDERIVDAVLSAPGALSGLSDELFGKIRDLVVERRHGDQVAKIREAEETAEAAQAALQVAQNDIKAATGLSDAAFEQLQKMNTFTPWLVRDGDKVLKVIPGQGSYPLASADEIATGKFYTNSAEYLRDNPGAQIPAAA